MSSSNPPVPAPEAPLTGRIIMGVGANGPTCMRLEDLDGPTRRPGVWTEKNEEEYLRRVRDKAQAMARDILEKAMAEAEAAKAQARDAGLDEARALARGEVEDFLANSAQRLGQALESARSGCSLLWNEHRQDLVTLVRLTVEKLLNVELAARREEILGALLDQALAAVDAVRGFTVSVAPADRELMEELAARAKAQNTRLSHFTVRADPKITPGGLVLETDQGMADNTLEGRWKAIEPILDQLALDVESGADGGAGAGRP